jgi:hypothetical protein
MTTHLACPPFRSSSGVIRVLNGNLHPELSQEILNPAPLQAPLVLADSEHYTTELLDHVHLETPFELLVPMPPQNSPNSRTKL